MAHAPLAGGYRRGDRVRSLIEHANVRKGDIGMVERTCTDNLADKDSRLLVDFGSGKGKWNMHVRDQVERPSPSFEPQLAPHEHEPGCEHYRPVDASFVRAAVAQRAHERDAAHLLRLEDKPRTRLRFKVGDRVLCNHDEGLMRGAVAATWYRESHFPPGRAAAYQVSLDGGGLIYAPRDRDDCIKADYRMEKLLRLKDRSHTRLRLAEGDRVIISEGAEWMAGTITRLWYTASTFPPGRAAPYQVRLDDGTLIYVPTDDVDAIQRAPGSSSRGGWGAFGPERFEVHGPGPAMQKVLSDKAEARRREEDRVAKREASEWEKEYERERETAREERLTPSVATYEQGGARGAIAAAQEKRLEEIEKARQKQEKRRLEAERAAAEAEEKHEAAAEAARVAERQGAGAALRTAMEAAATKNSVTRMLSLPQLVAAIKDHAETLEGTELLADARKLKERVREAQRKAKQDEAKKQRRKERDAAQSEVAERDDAPAGGAQGSASSEPAAQVRFHTFCLARVDTALLTPPLHT